jgi:hypothetical protein
MGEIRGNIAICVLEKSADRRGELKKIDKSSHSDV